MGLSSGDHKQIASPTADRSGAISVILSRDMVLLLKAIGVILPYAVAGHYHIDLAVSKDGEGIGLFTVIQILCPSFTGIGGFLYDTASS
jgi:hypothetical protein